MGCSWIYVMCRATSSATLRFPTGVPLVYDLESRCLHLFDDGILPKPRDRYDFGAAADVIFRPVRRRRGLPADPPSHLDDAFCEDSELDRPDAAEPQERGSVLDLDDETTPVEHTPPRRSRTLVARRQALEIEVPECPPVW